MYKGKKILAIIPARGGSKGVPGKNIKPLLGKPLIYYSIKSGQNSKYVDELVVSTDDSEIKKVSMNYNVKVIDRPKEFAKDNSPTIDAVKHAIAYSESTSKKSFDIIILLEPTSPLRKKGDIDKAISTFVDKYDSADGLVSLGKVGLENPFITKKLTPKGYMEPIISSNKKSTRRQDLPVAYFPYGVIYLVKKSILLKKETFYPDKTLPYFIERWQNFEIDDIYDFKIVETMMKEKLADIDL